ncbi:MAG TPA: hypothetical protein VF956_02610 [Candidatus Dormibacteraeota bacterium]
MPIGTNLVLPTVVAVVVLLAIVAMARRAGRTSRLLLSPLTSEARTRYAARWDEIESHFVEAPEESVAQADALALAVLGECDHPLAEKRLPERMRKARREASRGGTEGLRVAMLDYRGVIEEIANLPEAQGPAREGRRETA